MVETLWFGYGKWKNREETRFPGFESRVGSFLENVAEEVRFPGYMGAVPGSIRGGDSERVPTLLSPQVQSSGILVVVENEGPMEAHQGGGDTDLEVSPPSTDSAPLEVGPGEGGHVLFQLAAPSIGVLES